LAVQKYSGFFQAIVNGARASSALVCDTSDGTARPVSCAQAQEDTMNANCFSISRLAAPAIIAGVLLSPTTPALAQQGDSSSTRAFDNGRCSNRTLRGDYAFHVEGVFVDAPSPLPLRGVALTHFDGRGHLTQVDHVVFNGMLPLMDWTPATGTYRINADCTGEAEIIIPGSPFSPVTLRLVVGDDGSRIETVVSKPGYVVTSTATKVNRTK
jgi:hypothetical protein